MDEEAFRYYLATLSTAQIESLYDLTVEGWRSLGISRETFANNIAARRDFDSIVVPLQLAYEAYLEMSDRAEALTQAHRTYVDSLRALNRADSGSRPYIEIQREIAILRRTYDAAIASVGDDRVDAAKRVYERAAREESEKFAKRLR